MPHSIFFTKLGHAIHGTMDRRRLGSAASHGCVRLSTANAATLYALVKQKGLANTQVVVTARRPANALVARRTLRPVPESKMGPTPLQATFEQNNTVFGFTQPERSD